MHVEFLKDNNDTDILQIDDARIKFRNFSGKEDQFNRDGKRSFCWIIDDPDLADELAARGWNVKIRPARDEDADADMFMKVNVNYSASGYGPRVYLKSGDAQVMLDSESINRLDEISIESVDMDIRAYDWEYAGRTGRTAYLNSIRVTQRMDRFADDYNRRDYYEENPF